MAFTCTNGIGCTVEFSNGLNVDYQNGHAYYGGDFGAPSNRFIAYRIIFENDPENELDFEELDLELQKLIEDHEPTLADFGLTDDIDDLSDEIQNEREEQGYYIAIEP